MLKDKLSSPLILGGMAIVGLVAGVATMASAQTTSPTVAATTATTTTQTVDTPEQGDVADVTQGHAPIGGDGVVSSITGTTIVMTEESNEGAASYTIDASKATITNNDASGTLADVKVGAKIFVNGTTNGTNIAATSISLGHPGGHGDHGNDANEPEGSTDTGSDQ